MINRHLLVARARSTGPEGTSYTGTATAHSPRDLLFFIFLVPRLGLGRISEGLPARPRQRSRTEFHHVLLLRARTRSTSWALAPHGSRPKICLPQLQKIHCCLPPTFRFLPFLPSLLSNKPPAHHLFSSLSTTTTSLLAFSFPYRRSVLYEISAIRYVRQYLFYERLDSVIALTPHNLPAPVDIPSPRTPSPILSHPLTSPPSEIITVVSSYTPSSSLRAWVV